MHRPLAATLTFGAALLCGVAFAGSTAAAEFEVTGRGTFKPFTAEQLNTVPAGVPFSRADLQTGRWSFSIRYDDAMADADPDPYTGRYPGAIRSFRVTIGDTTIDLPPQAAALSISDGGGAARQRETIRFESASTVDGGTLRAGWIQIHQPSRTADLRGAAGLLASDAVPAPAVMANLDAASPFDRFFFVRIDAPTGARKPLVYLSSSQLEVAAAPVTAAR